jgi:hypothetical protein
VHRGDVQNAPPSARFAALTLAGGAATDLLFVAALVWAHHWGLLTLALVGTWGVALVGTPVLWVLAARRDSCRWMRRVGGWLNVLCWLALGAVPFVLLLGADVPSCGGA